MFAEVLGSILGALKSIVAVIGMTRMTPPIKDLLPRLTPILKNRCGPRWLFWNIRSKHNTGPRVAYAPVLPRIVAVHTECDECSSAPLLQAREGAGELH